MSKYFTALQFAKAVIDWRCLVVSKKPWQSCHAPFVLSAINVICSQYSLEVAIAEPIVYIWVAHTDQNLVYFGESSRGLPTRTREELEHAVDHLLRNKCTVAKQKGSCREKLHIDTVKCGLHKMMIMPHQRAEA